MSVDLKEVLNTSVGSLSLGNILSAAVTLLFCLVVIRFLMKMVRRLVSRTHLEERVKTCLSSGIKLVLYVIAALIVVDSLGIPVGSLVALLSVGSLGVTLAAEDILGNVAGGLVILSSRPFTIGDFVEVSGVSGTVQEITLNHTKLVTTDGLVALLPNKELASTRITNCTVLGRRRAAWKVSASYDAPTETVKSACEQAIADTEKVLQDPPPAVYLTSYGESAIEYTVYCWSATEDYWDVYFALGENLRAAFDRHGVEMTYNHLNVHILGGQD